jgi:hypothetical protein
MPEQNPNGTRLHMPPLEERERKKKKKKREHESEERERSFFKIKLVKFYKSNASYEKSNNK